MNKQDRQGVRTASELERKYAIGQSLKKAQGGIQKAAEEASQAKAQAQTANAGLGSVGQAAAEAKQLAENAADAAFRAENKVDGMSLSVENGPVTAKIILKVGQMELPVTIDMQGLATVEKLKTAGGAQVHGENIIGEICLSDEQGGHTKLSPEGVVMRRLEADENGEETEAARAELGPAALVFPLGNGRVSGIVQPEEDTDAVNRAYLESYVTQALDKLREELANKVAEAEE